MLLSTRSQQAPPMIIDRRSLNLVHHQFATRSVAFLRHFMERDNNAFPARSGFFNQCIGDPFCNFAFLLGGAPLQHRDLNHWHEKKPLGYFASSYPAKKKLNSKRAVSSAS